MGRGVWTQLELKPMQGSEPWVVVRYQGGHFFLPSDAAVKEAMVGVQRKWQARTRGTAAAGTVRVPLQEWLRLQ